MNSWLQAMNPTAPIEGESDALRAARSSAISIFIGVAVGAVSAAWSFMNADALAATAAVSANTDAETAAVVEAGVQAGLWMGIGLVVVQLVFAVIQWRDPKKWIAILFLLLIALGLAGVLISPMLASLSPAQTPATPLWQMALSVVVMAIQAVLHFAGLRGINRLDAIQMAAAR